VCLDWLNVIAGDCSLLIAPPSALNESSFNFTGICDDANNCYDFETVNYTVREPECSQTELDDAVQTVHDELAFDPFEIQNVVDLIFEMMKLQAWVNARPILGCRDLAVSLVRLGPDDITINTTECRKPIAIDGEPNPDYWDDPCCSRRSSSLSLSLSLLVCVCYSL